MHTISLARDYHLLFEEFFEVFQRRPILDNTGGMMLPHMFGAWVFLRESHPEVVVESGVWRGQSTWLIEQATSADIISIDLDLSRRTYISSRATYSDIDFCYHDLGDLPKGATTLFFDDHVNAFKRLQQGRAWGFTNFIFEDNYAAGMGDTPSLKQLMQGAFDGFGSSRLPPDGSVKSRLKRLLRPLLFRTELLAERYDPKILRKALNRLDFAYEEFPPITTFATTRGGLGWQEVYGDIHACIELDRLPPEQRAAVEAEGRYYTSICAVRPAS